MPNTRLESIRMEPMEIPTPRAIFVCGFGQGAGKEEAAAVLFVVFDMPVWVELTVGVPATGAGVGSVLGVSTAVPALKTVVTVCMIY